MIHVDEDKIVWKIDRLEGIIGEMIDIIRTWAYCHRCNGHKKFQGECSCNDSMSECQCWGDTILCPVCNGHGLSKVAHEILTRPEVEEIFQRGERDKARARKFQEIKDLEEKLERLKSDSGKDEDKP